MFEHIDVRSNIAVYVQIENQVQFAIASGKLKADDPLPSLQKLATNVGVNINTVSKAYRDLQVMGYVYAVRGSGVFVKKGIEGQCRELVRQRIIERLHEVVAEAKAAGMTSTKTKEIARKSYSSDAGLYAETPKSLLALAKSK